MTFIVKFIDLWRFTDHNLNPNCYHYKQNNNNC